MDKGTSCEYIISSYMSATISEHHSILLFILHLNYTSSNYTVCITFHGHFWRKSLIYVEFYLMSECSGRVVTYWVTSQACPHVCVFESAHGICIHMLVNNRHWSMAKRRRPPIIHSFGPPLSLMLAFTIHNLVNSNVPPQLLVGSLILLHSFLGCLATYLEFFIICLAHQGVTQHIANRTRLEERPKCPFCFGQLRGDWQFERQMKSRFSHNWRHIVFHMLVATPFTKIS